MSNFLHFMVEAGFKLSQSQEFLCLIHFLDYEWTLHDEDFAFFVIDHEGLIDWSPNTRQAKKNLRRLLVRDNNLVDLPEIAKIVLRESVLDLREALQSGLVKSNDVIEFPYSIDRSLLELAVGWPDGVLTLLEFGAEASKVYLFKCPYRVQDTNDLDCDGFRDSLVPLLQRGCIVESTDITRCKSKTIRDLLIDELARRRKKLLDVARSCLPPSRLAEITGPGVDNSIPNVHAFRIYAELIATNSIVDLSLQCDATFDNPIYHGNEVILDAWDDLYLAGFRDIDLPDSRGFTPLMVAGLSYDFTENRVIWLVDKGASLSKRLPSSNTTVAHLLTSRLARQTLYDCDFSGEYHQGDHPFSKPVYDRRDTIFMIYSIRDCCTCFCTDGGCTALSVALRQCNTKYHYQEKTSATSLYFFILNSLIDLTEQTEERDRTIIRLLTFEAIGLRHTCCREIGGQMYGSDDFATNIMNEEEIRNIQEEDQHGYGQLRELVEEFKTHFDDLKLPIIDFLKGPWYARMAQVLSAWDPYDEEHILQNRQNGVFLEPVESHDIPFFLSFFGSQIEEL